MCQRVAAFKPLSGWAVELLCEKAIGSNFSPMPPGEAFRRTMEAISTGIFLPGNKFYKYAEIFTKIFSDKRVQITSFCFQICIR